MKNWFKGAFIALLAGLTTGIVYAHGGYRGGYHGGFHGGYHEGYHGGGYRGYGGYHHGGVYGGVVITAPLGRDIYPYTYTYPNYSYIYPEAAGHYILINGQWIFVPDDY